MRSRTREHAKDCIEFIVILAVALFALWFCVAEAAWPHRNPKANETTFWSEMPAPMRFERMAKYQ